VGESCQVDFYVLANPGHSGRRLGCRLAMMAWEQGHQVAVLTENDDEAESLDELMWDFPPGRFLPHSLGGSEPGTPVSIHRKGTDIAPDRDVVINLANSAVPDPARFSRLLEIVPGDEGRRLASRHKFREYREQGLKPESHEIGKTQ